MDATPHQRELGDLTVNPDWFEGVGPVLDVLTDEIRAQLGREPDTGDLLIALAGVSESLAARTLSELGVAATGLAEAVARTRSQKKSGGGRRRDRAHAPAQGDCPGGRGLQARQRARALPHPGASFKQRQRARRNSSPSQHPGRSGLGGLIALAKCADAGRSIIKHAVATRWWFARRQRVIPRGPTRIGTCVLNVGEPKVPFRTSLRQRFASPERSATAFP